MSNKSNVDQLHCFTWMEEKFIDNTNPTKEQVNYFFLERNLGGIVFISIMMVVGLVGNITAIGIFAIKFKATNYRTYTLWLAGLDMANCCFGMPFLLIYHTNFITFPSIAVCKMGRFMNVFTGTASGFLLVVIAIDRYIHVCKPCNLNKMSLFQSRVCSVGAAITGLSFSWPPLVFFGNHTFGKQDYDQLPNGINGTRCWEDDEYIEKDYLSGYYIALSVLSFVITVVLFVIYSLIARYIYKNKVTNRVKHTRKVTFILLAITIAYVVSSLPHSILIVVLLKTQNFQCNLTFTQGSLLYIFVWLNLVNNVVNPIIYGFSDAKFRLEIKHLLLKVHGGMLATCSRTETDTQEDKMQY